MKFTTDTPRPTVAELIESSQPTDWRALDPENTLYLQLNSQRVVIELAPDFAPLHVANIRALAREQYWDGFSVVRVNDNYVVQVADPYAEQPDKKRAITSARETLPAEFDRVIDHNLPFAELPDRDVYASSVGFTKGFPTARDKRDGRTWLVHCYGAVSAGRETDIDSGGGKELTIVIGHAPRQLDRNVMLVGYVRQGMGIVSSLPRGSGHLGFQESPTTPVQAVRIASEVPYAERSHLDVMRTDTPLFTQLIESRRNRHEEWFHRPAGRVEICNVSVPVRLVYLKP